MVQTINITDPNCDKVPLHNANLFFYGDEENPCWIIQRSVFPKNNESESLASATYIGILSLMPGLWREGYL